MKILSGILLLLLSLIVNGQNCMDLLAAAYSKMEKPLPEEKDKCAYFEYIIKSTSSVIKGADKPLVSSVHYYIWARKDYIVMESNLADVYKNNEYTIAINHLAKIVTVGYSASPVSNDENVLGIKSMREGILMHSVLESCSTKVEDPKVKVLTLIVNENARDFSTVRKLRFEINSVSQDLLKATIYFTSIRQDISRLDYSFIRIDYSNDDQKFKKNILDNILDNKGKLLPEFKDFEYYDLRKQKS